MEPNHRITRFPGADQFAISKAREERFNTNRQTRFPGGTELQKISILEEPSTKAKSNETEVSKIPSRLPLKVNPPDTTPGRPLPTTTIKKTQQNQPPHVRTESPWDTYMSLRTLERGGEVTAAYRREVPIAMVAVKKLSSNYIRRLDSPMFIIVVIFSFVRLLVIHPFAGSLPTIHYSFFLLTLPRQFFLSGMFRKALLNIFR